MRYSSTSSTDPRLHAEHVTIANERNNSMKKFAKVIVHSALVATLITLLSTVASASAVWGN